MVQAADQALHKFASRITDVETDRVQKVVADMEARRLADMEAKRSERWSTIGSQPSNTVANTPVHCIHQIYGSVSRRQAYVFIISKVTAKLE